MIKCTIGNNMSRKSVIVSETDTLSDAIAKSGIDFSGRTIQLNGRIISDGDMGKSFAALGVAGEAWLLSVAKLENA